MSEILIAPLSHNPLRDWPVLHYKSLIEILLGQLPKEIAITLVGSPNQRLIVDDIVRPFPADRVFNTCGLPWNDVIGRTRGARCVIGNNSGLAHLAGLFGVPTVCIFGGTHQRTEWAPLRPNVVVLSRVIGCSPCQYYRTQDCPYDVACLREIAPKTVAESVFRLLQPAARSAKRQAGEAA